MSRHRLIGQKAPEFTLRNADNEEFNFNPVSDDKRPTALFFYPQSGTYGCTKEACQFNSALKEEPVFKSRNVRVIGISPDSVTKQKKFVDKNQLTYTILSDEKGEARQKYYVPRGLMGLTASSRVTFVIDSEGIINDVLDATLNFAAHYKFVQYWLDTQVEYKKPELETVEKHISGEESAGLGGSRSSSETNVNSELVNDVDQSDVNANHGEPSTGGESGTVSSLLSTGMLNEAETDAATATSTNTAVESLPTPATAVTPTPA